MLAALLIVITAITPTAQAETMLEIVTDAEVKFQPLNPARGDASPQAGVLWGDIRQDLSTGTLVKFADGFSSPPHIHNITYRGVVIRGAVHNDDPNADKMWMESGSFWVQPAGENHITAAKGKDSLIFLEIMTGPYLVQPPNKAFDNGERPINMAANNVVWLNASDTTWIKQTGASPNRTEIAFLWGKPKDHERHGTFVKLASGFQGKLQGSASWLRAVVIQGQITHNGDTVIEPSGYFGSKGKTVHALSCESMNECLLYISTTGKYTVHPEDSVKPTAKNP